MCRTVRWQRPNRRRLPAFRRFLRQVVEPERVLIRHRVLRSDREVLELRLESLRAAADCRQLVARAWAGTTRTGPSIRPSNADDSL